MAPVFIAKTALASPAVVKALPFNCAVTLPDGQHLVSHFEVLVMTTSIRVCRAQEDGLLEDVLEQSLQACIVNAAVLTPSPDAPVQDLVEGNDVLVLTNDRGDLVLFALGMDEHSTPLRFTPLKYIETSTTLPSMGTHLAVDPHSRAILVGAHKHIVRAVLMSPPEAGGQLVTCTVPGVVIDMAFLHPSSSEASVIHVAVLSSSPASQYHLGIYRIDHVSSALVASTNLAQNAIPTHVLGIPHCPLSLLVVTERTLVMMLMTESRLQWVKATELQFHSRIGKNDPLVSCCAWDTADTSRIYPPLIMGTDAGDVARVDIVPEGQNRFSFSWTPLSTGRSPIALVWPVAPSVYGLVGAFGDGELLSVGGDITSLSTIANWLPLNDFKVVNMFNSDSRAIVAVGGSGSSGSILQMTNGIQVSTMTKTEQQFQGVTAMWSLKPKATDKNDAFILLSFANSTRLMALINSEFDDYSEGSGLRLEETTIACGPLFHNQAVSTNAPVIIQVTTNRICVAMPSGAASPTLCSWLPPADSSITCASVDALGGGIVVVALSKSQSIIVLGVIPTSTSINIQVLCEFKLPNDVSSINVQICLNTAYVLVGTYEPELVVLSLNNNSLHEIQTISLGGLSKDSLSIPESAQVVESENSKMLVAGLRDGIVISWPVAETVLINEFQIRRTGSTRVSLLPFKAYNPLKEAHYPSLLALSATTWQVVPSQRLSKWTMLSYGKIDCATPFAFEGAHQSFLFACDGELHFTLLDTSGGKIHVEKHPLNKTPKRLLVDDGAHRVYVALAGQEEGDSPELRVLSALTFETLGSHRFQQGPGTPYAISRLSQGSFAVGLATASLAGELAVVDFSDLANPVQSPLRISFSKPVVGLALYRDHYLVVGEGNNMYLYDVKVDDASGAFVQIEQKAKHTTRFNVRSIQTTHSRIIVTDQRDSVMHFKVRVTSSAVALELFQCDPIFRLTATAVPVTAAAASGGDATLILTAAADLQGHVYGVQEQLVPATGTIAGMKTLFDHKILCDVPLKLAQGVLASTPASSLVEEEEDALAAQNDVGILCMGVLGSITAIRSVPSALVRPLYALQRCLARLPQLRPLAGPKLQGPSSSAPLNRIATHHVLDGDLLACTLSLPRATLLSLAVSWDKELAQLEVMVDLEDIVGATARSADTLTAALRGDLRSSIDETSDPSAKGEMASKLLALVESALQLCL